MSDTPEVPVDDDARWAEKKRKQKAARDRMLATKDPRKGSADGPHRQRQGQKRPLPWVWPCARSATA